MTTMRKALSPPALASSSSGSPASAFFAFEQPAASLSDLEIVRKIVEREGCLEALEQLLRSSASSSSSRKTAAHAVSSEIEQLYPYTYPQRSMATASPMVLQSLLEQLRSVSVQIVEAIEQWRARTQALVFQWRQLNYLLKMTSDLDFLASMVPAVERVDALQNLRLERNPFLAPLHLDHPALREKTPDAAVLLGLWVGAVDMRRVFSCCRVLLRELEAEQKRRELARGASDDDDDDSDDGFGGPLDARDRSFSCTAAVDPSVLAASKHQAEQPRGSRVRWSNQEVRSSSSSSSRAARHPPAAGPPADRREELRRDVELSRELIRLAEHELGAIREEIAILHEKLAAPLARSAERQRQLQTKVGALVNALKLKSGDLFQRKNELRRREAAHRLACASGKLGGRASAPAAGHAAPAVADARSSLSSPSSAHPFLRAVECVMQSDELQRQETVERFAALRTKPPRRRAASPSKSRRRAGGVSAMTPDDVAAFVDALALGDGASGAAFKAQGIDGALLLQATDRDLEALGVALRLHRVRILEAAAAGGESEG